MKTEYIIKLLDKYYDGSSSYQEEKELAEYFSGNEISPDLRDEQLIFNNLHIEEDIPYNEHFESSIEKVIDSLSEEDVSVSSFQAKPKRNTKFIFWASSIAASVLLLVSIGFVYLQHDKPKINNTQIALRDTYSDPDKAYAEAEKALMLISKNLNKGISEIETLNEGVDKSNEIIEKNLNRINNK